MEGWPGNEVLVPFGAVGQEEIKDLLLWGGCMSANCFTFAHLPVFASCGSSMLPARGQLSPRQQAMGILSLEKTLDFKLLNLI